MMPLLKIWYLTSKGLLSNLGVNLLVNASVQKI